jgi:hypothetical protein
MHGGISHAVYQRSVEALKHAIEKDGGRFTAIRLGNESLINRARNTIAWHFLQTDATHLLFCDGDIGFRVEDIARMMWADKPIIIGCCPMKTINWARIHAAARAGHGPEDLERFAAVFAMVHLPGERRVSADRPFEIKYGGSGVMLIQRAVFERLAETVPTYTNKNPGTAMPFGVKVHDFFPTHIVDDDLLSEDYGFCELWRKAGGTIWAAPWCELTHMGTYGFTGRYADAYGLVTDRPRIEEEDIHGHGQSAGSSEAA